MSTKNYEDLSVVKLKDGRTGTIVHLYSDGEAVCVEIENTEELVDVPLDGIEEVLWRP